MKSNNDSLLGTISQINEKGFVVVDSFDNKKKNVFFRKNTRKKKNTITDLSELSSLNVLGKKVILSGVENTKGGLSISSCKKPPEKAFLASGVWFFANIKNGTGLICLTDKSFSVEKSDFKSKVKSIIDRDNGIGAAFRVYMANGTQQNFVLYPKKGEDFSLTKEYATASLASRQDGCFVEVLPIKLIFFTDKLREKISEIPESNAKKMQDSFVLVNGESFDQGYLQCITTIVNEKGNARLGMFLANDSKEKALLLGEIPTTASEDIKAKIADIAKSKEDKNSDTKANPATQK